MIEEYFLYSLEEMQREQCNGEWRKWHFSFVHFSSFKSFSIKDFFDSQAKKVVELKFPF